MKIFSLKSFVYCRDFRPWRRRVCFFRYHKTAAPSDDWGGREKASQWSEAGRAAGKGRNFRIPPCRDKIQNSNEYSRFPAKRNSEIKKSGAEERSKQMRSRLPAVLFSVIGKCVLWHKNAPRGSPCGGKEYCRRSDPPQAEKLASELLSWFPARAIPGNFSCVQKGKTV